jgi:uncharacterized protein YqgV (UPF0045/DUF77 family)
MPRNTGGHVIAEIQCLTTPRGTAADPYKHIEAAIAVIERSGLTFEVDALGTTIEGDPDAVWATLRQAHDACIASGADSVVTILKVAQARPEAPQSSIASLTGKFRS